MFGYDWHIILHCYNHYNWWRARFLGRQDGKGRRRMSNCCVDKFLVHQMANPIVVHDSLLWVLVLVSSLDFKSSKFRPFSHSISVKPIKYFPFCNLSPTLSKMKTLFEITDRKRFSSINRIQKQNWNGFVRSDSIDPTSLEPT